MIHTLGFILSLTAVYLAARYMAYRAAEEIAVGYRTTDSKQRLLMFISRRINAALAASLLFAVTFDSIVLGIAAFAFCSFFNVIWYSFVFDQRLNIVRGFDRWYISEDPEATGTDAIIREFRDKNNLSNREANLHLKMPLMIIAFCLCAIIVILG